MADFFRIFAESLWLMLPAYAANMAPDIFKNLFKPLAVPLDLGMKWRGKRVLGSHKTFRGLLFGVLFGVLFAYAQRILFEVSPLLRSLSIIDYSSHSPLLIGFLLGFGALVGDSAESFFKRRRGIKPGKAWIPFDYLDWILGSVLFLSPVFVPPLPHLAMIFLLFPVLHLIVNNAAFSLGMRSERF